LELNCAGEIEVPVAREGGRVVGIWVMVRVETGLVVAISEDEGSVEVPSEEGEKVGVLVAGEDMPIELIVWLAD
jgi:hypothetical protein